MLDSMNVEQCMKDNRANLEKYGGVDGLASALGISLETGLTHEQVITMRAKYGTNMFPETPLKGFITLFIEGIIKISLIFQNHFYLFVNCLNQLLEIPLCLFCWRRPLFH
jgi:hypothetical protein